MKDKVEATGSFASDKLQKGFQTTVGENESHIFRSSKGNRRNEDSQKGGK